MRILMTSFELVEPPADWDAPEPPKHYGNRGIPSAQCQCGRFAKFVALRKRYNGWSDVDELTVDCKRCGRVSYLIG